jgi:hypothetical protein
MIRRAGLALLLLGALRAAAQAPFDVTAPLAGQALFGCEGVRLETGALVDAAGNTTGSLAGSVGHVVSGGDVVLVGRVVVRGDATAGPGGSVTASPQATVTAAGGSTSRRSRGRWL